MVYIAWEAIEGLVLFLKGILAMNWGVRQCWSAKQICDLLVPNIMFSLPFKTISCSSKQAQNQIMCTQL